MTVLETKFMESLPKALHDISKSLSEISDKLKNNADTTWGLVYEEEHDGYFLGVVSNGENYLFVKENLGDKHTVSVYNSMTFSEDTLECRFTYSWNNITKFYAALNSSNGHFCGEDGVLNKIKFDSI